MSSMTDHQAAAYSLTEEFVSVYRMHPLIRDDLPVCSVTSGQPIRQFSIKEIAGENVRSKALGAASMEDLFYSFGICHPGALTLRNFPGFLRDFARPDGERVDLAAIDILRDRDRAVPR